MLGLMDLASLSNSSSCRSPLEFEMVVRTAVPGDSRRWKTGGEGSGYPSCSNENEGAWPSLQLDLRGGGGVSVVAGKEVVVRTAGWPRRRSGSGVRPLVRKIKQLASLNEFTDNRNPSL